MAPQRDQAAASGALAGLTRNTVLLAASSLFADIATEMLYPVLPIFLTQTLRTGAGFVGLIEGVATATSNIAQGFSGPLSDRLRRRKPIALTGYLLSALAKPFIGLAAGWPGVLGSRFFDRLGAGMRSAPRDALIAASANEAYRGRAFGLEGAGDNAGAFIGPLIAAALLSLAHFGLRAIFYLAVVPGLIASSMIALVGEERSTATPRLSASRAPGRLPAGYRRYLAASAVFGLGNSTNAFLILRVKGLGATLTQTILIYAGFNLVAALVSYPAGSLSDRFGRRDLAVAAMIVYAGCYLGLALGRNFIWVGALFLAYGVFQGVYRATGKALAADFAPAAAHARALGWYGAAVGLSGLVASLIGGLLWDQLGPAAVFLWGAGFAILGAVALVLLVPARIQPAT